MLSPEQKIVKSDEKLSRDTKEEIVEIEDEYIRVTDRKLDWIPRRPGTAIVSPKPKIEIAIDRPTTR
jgi:hypothetical protein